MFNTSVENDVKILSHYQLTCEELMLIKLLFYSKEHHTDPINQFMTECKHTDIVTIIQSLMEKGVLIKANVSEGTLQISDLVFNKVFLKGYMKFSYDLGMELFMAYPNILRINGVNYSAKNIAKKFNSLEEFSFFYAKSIGFNEEKHKHVMEMLEFAKENDLLHFGICEFVISQKWFEYEEIQKNGDYSYNNMELV